MNAYHRKFFFRSLGALLVASPLFLSATSRAADTDVDGIDDASDAVPCDSRAVSAAYAPGKGVFGTMLFEDQWPSNGDLDFNDVALAYNYIFYNDALGRVSSMQVSVSLLAAGASYENGVKLHLPVASDAAALIRLNVDDGNIRDVAPAANESELVVPLIADQLALLGGTLVNTKSTEPARPAHSLNLYIKFKEPMALDVSVAPFDLYIEKMEEAGHQIHLPEYAGTATMNTELFGTEDDASTTSRHFVDRDGLPFALVVPQVIAWPLETIAIDQAYPDIIGFASSGGTKNQDWYTNVRSQKIWERAPGPLRTPVMLGPKNPTEDTICAPWKDTVQFGLGPQKWVNGSASDRSGNVFVSGYTWPNQAGFVEKHNNDGSIAWTRTVPEAGHTTAVACDAGGNVYAVGHDSDARAGFVVKVGPSGDVLWKRTTTSNSIPSCVSVAPDGSIYTAEGNASDSFKSWKFDADGNPLWTKTIAPTGDVTDSQSMPQGMASGPNGNVVVSGSANGKLGDKTFAVNLNSSGDHQWTHSFDANQTMVRGVAVDTNGETYVTGSTSTQPSCSDGACKQVYKASLSKLDKNGVLIWTADTNSDNGQVIGQAVAVDSDGNAITVGHVSGSVDGLPFAGDIDYFLAKFDSIGNKLWTQEGGTSQRDVGYGVCTDSSASIFVAGTANNSTTKAYEGFIVKFDKSGKR